MTALALAALGASACDERPPPTAVDIPTATRDGAMSSGPASAIRAGLPDSPLTHDDFFRSASELHPRFAGLYVEDDGLRVLSTDPAIERAQLEAAVAAVLEVAGRQKLASRIQDARIVEARYGKHGTEMPAKRRGALPVS